MRQYLDIMRNILRTGSVKHPTRLGISTVNSTIGLPNQVFNHDMSTGFPLLTTRRLPWKGLVGELRCFLLGSNDFEAHGCNFWKPWANLLSDRGVEIVRSKTVTSPAEPGELGPIYGAQWQRDLPHILYSLQHNPTDRRMCCFAWNTSEHSQMVAPPCHLGWVVTVYNGVLHLSWFQRSSDWPIGVPINIGSYALLLTLLGHWANLPVGNLTCLFADAHIYENQINGATFQVQRQPRKLPTVAVTASRTDFNDWDVTLSGYLPYPNIDFSELEI